MTVLNSIFLDHGPAHTTNYMIMGFVVIFSVMAVYVISLNVRRRNLMRDLDLLKDLED